MREYVVIIDDDVIFKKCQGLGMEATRQGEIWWQRCEGQRKEDLVRGDIVILVDDSDIRCC